MAESAHDGGQSDVVLIRALKHWVASRGAARDGSPTAGMVQGRDALDRLLAGDLLAAQSLAQAALEAVPDDPEAHQVLALIAHDEHQFERAVEHFGAAIDARPAPDPHRLAVALSNRGDLYVRMGDLESALADFDRAIALDPSLGKAQANRLFALTYRAHTEPETLTEAHLAWARRFADPVAPVAKRHANAKTLDRRLRIGYVSPDLRRHAVASLLEPILAQRDRTAFEIVLYSTRAFEDEVTARLRAQADGWCDLSALDDDAGVRRIEADAIDILVDLAGHTAGNRLAIFARRPAPVQITHLGYLTTTGLRAIDYRISDALADPVGESEHLYAERVLRMPGCVWCHRPPPDSPPVGPLPARTNGFVTFGSFNRPAKLSEETLDVWAAVLAAVPDARMLIAAVESWDTRLRLQEALARRGVSDTRIEFQGEMLHRDLLALRQRTDISLDAYPCHGGITTCETLWMGVPVVSRLGRGFQSRLGLSLSGAVGLDALVGRNAQETVTIAAGLARDLDRLSALRAGMRQRLAASRLHDEVGYTRALEGLYRDAWRAWCGSAEPA